MIPIACKITNFSLYIIKIHSKLYVNLFTPYLKILRFLWCNPMLSVSLYKILAKIFTKIFTNFSKNFKILKFDCERTVQCYLDTISTWPTTTCQCQDISHHYNILTMWQLTLFEPYAACLTRGLRTLPSTHNHKLESKLKLLRKLTLQ